MIGLILLLPCIPFLSYAGNLSSENNIEEIKQKAPEFILHEEDFTYENYKDRIGFIKTILDEYEKGKKYDPYWDRNYIGIPNSLLQLEGYGLFTQRDIIRLKLENAKLKGTEGEIADLEKTLDEAERQIEVFLSENIWVD